MFRLDSSLDKSSAVVFSLKRVADWNHNYLVYSLGSYGNRIVVGDQISSLSLLNVGEASLVSVAKDYGPLYPISVEALDSDNIICANVSVEMDMFVVTSSKHAFRIVRTFARSRLVGSWVVQH